MPRNSMVGVLAAALTLGVAGNAFAADLPVKAVPLLVAAHNWSGCYVGLQTGVKFARNKDDYGANNLAIAPGTPASANYNFTGLEGGPTIGCNHQMANWVLGVEADWGWSTGTGEAVETQFPTFRMRTKERWLGTARGRMGYLVAPSWMIYATGGAAFTNVAFANFVPGSATFFTEQRRTITGWVVGIGTEHALNAKWSIKAEALYIDYGKKTFLAANDPVSVASYVLKLSEWVARVGVNYHF